MIRLGTQNDIPYLERLAKNYWAAGPYAVLSYDRDKVLGVIRDCIATGLVLVSANGALAAKVIEPHFSKTKMSAEIFLWSEAEGRQKVFEIDELHRGYEHWAKYVARVPVISTAAFGDTNYFTKRGYGRAETSFIARVE